MKRFPACCSLFAFIVIVDMLPLTMSLSMGKMINQKTVVRIPQHLWRQAAAQHGQRIREILEPGLLLSPDPATVARRQRRRSKANTENHNNDDDDLAAPLDPKHPVYNFLGEYYGLKGTKGPRQLARWSPSPGLLVQENLQITSMEDFEQASNLYTQHDGSHLKHQSNGSPQGVFLEGAKEDDFAHVLHLKGATVIPGEEGILYSPSDFFGKNDPSRRDDNARVATPFLWYQSIMKQTMSAEPILHCHGLHEWAMLYEPEGQPPPPSGKYQSHLPLRVSRHVINEAVERRGISCTHVDALRFFAKAAGPLNHHGSSLERMDQLRLEQPGCVHVHMDLLKIALKLRPFCDPIMIQRVLELSLEARRLDVAASPYDCSAYGVGAVPIETEEGRAQYRKEQLALMKRAEPIRRDLLKAFESFISLAFDESIVVQADRQPQPERFAKAEPGGLPWRQNLLSTSP
jgi:hypothetical protein